MKLFHLINNEWLEGGSLNANMNPHNGKFYCEFPCADKITVDISVNAARSAFNTWSKLPLHERIECVLSLVREIRKAYGKEGEITHLKEILIEEIGKPLPEADLEILECADFMQFFSDKAKEALADTNIEVNQEIWPSKSSTISKIPLGVVALIKPWNYPLEMICWSLAPALLSGNTVVIKASEKSPRITYEFSKLVKMSSLPDGVVNIILGDKDTGINLVSNADVNYVSFTGSVKAGQSIAKQCGELLRPCTLELGGNDPAIVLDDVNLQTAVNGIIWGAVCNSGQVCVGVKRVYVTERIYDKFVENLVTEVRKLRRGIDFGPLIDLIQFNKLQSVLNSLPTDCKLLTSGNYSENGYYFDPVVIAVPASNTSFLTEEYFGPLIPVIKVENVNEAIDLANKNKYALGASVWTSNLNKGKEIATKIDAGMVWINDVNVAFPECPWGGIKNSGYSFELSNSVFDKYTYKKHISVENNISEQKRFWWYPY